MIDLQASVVERLDSAIHCINHHPLDKYNQTFRLTFRLAPPPAFIGTSSSSIGHEFNKLEGFEGLQVGRISPVLMLLVQTVGHVSQPYYSDGRIPALHVLLSFM